MIKRTTPSKDSPSSDSVLIDGDHLTLADIESVARFKARVDLEKSARDRISQSAKNLKRLASSKIPIYGVNTGFGIFADRRLDSSQAAKISENLVLSHAVAVGDPFPEEVVRAAILIRANSLAHGYSGVRTELIEALLSLLNKGVTPYIPSQGSLGSSGDLAQLAQLALVITNSDAHEFGDTEVQAWFEDCLLPGHEAMNKAGIDLISLGPKEGLALTNGASFSTALLALAVIDSQRLLFSNEIASSMTLDALLGFSAALDERIHAARPYPGQQAVARRMRNLIAGSQLIDSTARVQDAYSLRCCPQILGPVWDTLAYADKVSNIEMNSATDNPLLFGDDVLSGGNFHGEPVGLAADYLKIALSEAGSISERQIFRLLSEDLNADLPPMLIADRSKIGLYSGLMMLHYTAGSLALENQALANPNSTSSVPTSSGQEDHNANATTAARNLRLVVENLTRIVAIELICVSQALELRMKEIPRKSPGVGTLAALEHIRKSIDFIEHDRPYSVDINLASDMIRSGSLLTALHNAGFDDYPLCYNL
ncbi:MAG: histidine ammonia-lyase [Anaerolineales bacterium]|nr:MAG: histidine ammonia-lyase [Anaerolineales bacterium]